MPLQNRVTPWGDLVSSPARGNLMGNRGGRLHRPDRTLDNRRWVSRAWIACVLCFKERRRSVMGPGYTELFFLDEPTALAAGHRPCFECRRAEANAFAAAWARAASLAAPPRAAEMDRTLHTERLTRPRPEGDPAALPCGAMVALGETAFLVWRGRLHPWSFQGYGSPIDRPPPGATLLTPPSIIRALAAGYSPRPPALP